MIAVTLPPSGRGALALVVLLGTFSPVASAQRRAATDPPDDLSVQLDAPPSLQAGDRAEVVARVSGAGPHPLLLTPRSEGTAIEVVRGRLMRADARDSRAGILQFRIPIVARSAGTAVLRVVVAGYACADRCRLVRAESSSVLRVTTSAERPGGMKRRMKQGAGSSPPDDGAPEGDDTEMAASGARERSSSLSWVRMPGAEGCIASASLARAVETQLSRSVFVSAAEGELAVEGRAERRDDGWRAVVQASDRNGEILGERTLESNAATCEELGEMVTVAVALMIDPLTRPPSPSAPDDVIVRRERVESPRQRRRRRLATRAIVGAWKWADRSWEASASRPFPTSAE